MVADLRLNNYRDTVVVSYFRHGGRWVFGHLYLKELDLNADNDTWAQELIPVCMLRIYLDVLGKLGDWDNALETFTDPDHREIFTNLPMEDIKDLYWVLSFNPNSEKDLKCLE